MTENSENLIKIVNELHDKLNPLGVDNLALNLPQIAVIGGQSAGKSSVLESFVGRDFLPRGNNIVTRRPLILQLINNKADPKSYGEFLHIPDKKFYDFSQIRDEINNETDREVKDNYGISSKPINLKIYSPNVLDLTLVDLPGMTRIPVGNQPRDIESRIEKMLLEHIEKENCLILAVTAANQDLATSDALKLAERVDPENKRTIGVLTKLDLMDKGTDARNILLGRHLPLKLGYIGIVNRSQRDIDTKKDMNKALADEREYFKSHPSYKDIANKQGVGYLQKYLNKELTKHIMRILPPLKHQFQSVLNDLNEQLEEIECPIQDSDSERILAQSNEEFRRTYESCIGGKGVKIDITKLSGGAKINLVMNDTYAKEINQMIYDENKMRREITTAIQNFYGIYLGVFTPDAAFKAVVEHQIELFRNPSIICVEWVSQELETVIKESVSKIKRFSKLKHLYFKLTIEFLREAKKRCKSKIDHFVEAEKSYLNTLHEDFVGIKSIENMKPISDSQLKVSAQVVDERVSKFRDRSNSELRSGFISIKKNDGLNEYLFVLKRKTLSWYKDENMKDKKGSISLKDAKVEQGENIRADTLILHIGKWSVKTMELLFDSRESADQWREWLEESGVKSDGNKPSFYNNSDNYSVSNMSMTSDFNESQEEMAYADHMRAPVDQVKRLVDSYVLITKKKFKDYVPKMCTIEMVDSTLEFIATKLRVKVRDTIKSIDDIVEGDPDEELRRDLTKKTVLYSEAVDIIEKFTRYDHAKLY